MTGFIALIVCVVVLSHIIEDERLATMAKLAMLLYVWRICYDWLA